MSYLFGFVALLLAGAIVVLFAMLGELASRMGTGAEVDTYIEPLTGVPLGHRPAEWPEGLSALGTAEESVALVLSTACNSCRIVAEQLRARPELAEGTLAVIVSTADAARAEQFTAEHALGRLPRYIDVGGDWVTAEFGVRTSPSALMFRHGRLAAAYVFTDLAALRAVKVPNTDVSEQEDSWHDMPTKHQATNQTAVGS